MKEVKWSLFVKNFGKIKSADIELSPFIIFIGDNNSGKSYLMSLLWGVINKFYYILKNYNDVNSKYYNACKTWFNSLNDKKNIIIDYNAAEMFVNWLSEVLYNNRQKLVHYIFNKDVCIDEIKIILKNAESSKIDIDKLKEKIASEHNTFSEDNILIYICDYILFDDFKKRYISENEPLFLPAARTGFVLTYKTLISESMKSGFGRGSVNSRFTAPVINFLSRFISLEAGTNKNFSDIVSFLENNLVQGKIIEDESPIKNIYYKPENLNQNIPLYLTSSLITEISPLLLFLNDKNSEFKTMIIEEPEAHLHLKAQVVMARVCVRLVNRGLNLWLTTHSDTFFQQLNNLMKLNVHPKRDELLKKLNFKESECLDVNKVKVYEFKVKDDRTEVSAVQASSTGFPVENFNSVLYKLYNEVNIMEEDDD